MKIVVDTNRCPFRYNYGFGKCELYEGDICEESDVFLLCPLLLLGIPLPKGHGRLIDAAALMEVIEENVYPLSSKNINIVMLGVKQAIKKAETIIEADKEGE